MDPLFPELPEDLSELSDEDLANLLQEHEVAADLIDSEDEDFIKGMPADEVLSQYEKGVDQIEQIHAEQQRRIDAENEYKAQKQALADRRKAASAVEESAEEDDGDGDGDGDEDAEAEAEELAAEEDGDGDGDEGGDGDGDAEPEAEKEKTLVASKKALRRPPQPSRERQLAEQGAVLVAAAGLQDVRAGAVLDRVGLAKTMRTTAIRRGSPSKSANGIEEKIRIASAQFTFPDDRRLDPSDWERNSELIRQVIPADTVPGFNGLVASGGLCAPLTPIYTMPNFATQERPVRDALPSFQADRGGVNVPEATIIGDITSAITVIEESEDALGGTFATKSCQDLECPAYTETAVTIISHCREYGNLNARAWPEKIAHENDLTMAAHARTAETYLLERIKALSVNVTNGAETLGALIYLVDAIVKAKFGIMGRLRMSRGARFRALLPAILPDLLALDTVQTQFDRYRTADSLIAYLRGFNIDPVFYLDGDFAAGADQIPDAEQAAGALDALPDTIQWAIFPEGAFIHVDGGSLELGIVRDSTLNSTNDYQIFGETFENVARLGPAQSTLWVTSDLCASGQFPPAGTARTCD